MSPVKFGFGWVRRAIIVAPVEFVLGPIRRAIMTSLGGFVLEPGARAIKITPGVIAPIAVTDAVPIKIMVSGSVKFLRPAASIGTAVAASFAFGP
jgi:hypothetical protein